MLNQCKRELGIGVKAGVGFLYGAGIHVKRFHFSYGRSIYHIAGGGHHFSISRQLKKG